MPIDKITLARTAAAFDALNFASENARISEIEAEAARADEAIGNGETRCTEIARTLADWRGPDAGAVADALLAEVAPITAAKAGPNAGDMEAERLALRSGIGDLRRRQQVARGEIAAIQEAVFARVAEAAAPLVEAVLTDAQEAAGRIVEAYAALSAINLTARAATLEAFRARRATERLLGMDNLLSHRRDIEVPAELTAALNKLRGKGPAFPLRLMMKVPAP